MLIPTAYHLRSHGQEIATPGEKSLQKAVDSAEVKYTAEMMVNEDGQSTEFRSSKEQDKYTQSNKDVYRKKFASDVDRAEVYMKMDCLIQHFKSFTDVKKDHITTPGNPSELNSSTAVEKTAESQKLTGKSQKMTKEEEKQEQDIISCPKCRQTFERRSQLTEHIKSHSTDQVTCPICGKKLTSSNSRDRHILTHSQEKPYKCEFCQQTFSTNGNMNRHFKIHERKRTMSSERESKYIKEEEKISNMGGAPSQSDVSEEVNETPGFQTGMDDKDEVYSRNTYSKSLGLCRKPSNFQSIMNHEIASKSNLKGMFKKSPKKRKRSTVSEAEKIPEFHHSTTKASGNFIKKTCQEKFNDQNTKTYSNSTQSNSDCISNSNQTDSPDLAHINDIILNVQPRPATENQITKESSPPEQVPKPLTQLYPCDTCNYIAQDKNSLKRHALTHKRNGTFKCGICGMTFTNKANTQRHLKEIHNLRDHNLISEQIIFFKRK